MSVDARLTTSPNTKQRVTSDAADREVHRLRSGFDAIIVGANTARVDDPTLTVRHGIRPIRPPVRVVIDTNATLSPSSRLVQTMNDAPLVVICSETADTTALSKAGVPLITVPTEEHKWVDVEVAFEQLRAAGIYSLLCEGGGALAGSLLECGLIDRIYAFVAPKLFGNSGTPAFPLKNALETPRYELVRIAQHGEDALLMLDRCSQD
jgi:diaminohydroxyphosphoribosylaminopyrimidine deaminase / 5-amino-6-(5-phosphoribosylamino)uracil reductase